MKLRQLKKLRNEISRLSDSLPDTPTSQAGGARNDGVGRVALSLETEYTGRGKSALKSLRMKLATLLFGVRFFTVVALGAFLGVVFSVDPGVSGPVGTVLFLASLFIALTGMISLSLIFLMRKILGDVTAAHALGGSFRQGGLLAAYGIGILGLARWNVLAWWTAALLFAFVLLVELTIRRVGKREDS
jgi:hypothetical protein